MVSFLPLFFSPNFFLQCLCGLCVCKQTCKPSLTGLWLLVAEVPWAEIQVCGGGAAWGVLHPLRVVPGVQLCRGPVLEPPWHPALHHGLGLRDSPARPAPLCRSGICTPSNLTPSNCPLQPQSQLGQTGVGHWRLVGNLVFIVHNLELVWWKWGLTHGVWCYYQPQTWSTF